MSAGRKGLRPPDGFYISFWRLLLRFPQLLAWEHLWFDGYRDLTRLLSQRVKQAKPSVLFGSHIWPNWNFSPLFEAELDLKEFAAHHDFLKVPAYDNCGGPRLASYAESVSQTVWGDLSAAEALRFHYRVLGYDEAPYPEVRQKGLKGEFVEHVTKRALAAVEGTGARILVGVEVDIPILAVDLGGQPATAVPRCTRESVRRSALAALRAGAHGLVISREYTEMELENLSGVGDAIRQWTGSQL